MTYEYPEQKRRTGPGILPGLVLVTSGSLLTIALLVLFGIWQSGGRFLENLGQSFTPQPSEPQTDVRSLVVQQVRGASELTTAIMTIETVVPTSQDLKLGGFVIGTTRLLYIAHGEVRAGVDLSQIQPQDVQVQGEVITLRLPPPQILDKKIDVTRSGVYDYSRGFLDMGPDVAPELQDLAQKQALIKIAESACSQGLLKQANDRSQLVLSKLLTLTGYSKVLIETQPPRPGSCPRT